MLFQKAQVSHLANSSDFVREPGRPEQQIWVHAGPLPPLAFRLGDEAAFPSPGLPQELLTILSSQSLSHRESLHLHLLGLFTGNNL